MNKLSAVIITKNEESNIERCLISLQGLVDEIIVVDNHSTDNTLEICKKYRCKIYSKDWEGFGLAKREAVNKASHKWVLSIDADEEITHQLKEKIKDVLLNPKFNVYKVKRITFYLSKPIKHCGWDNDYPKRLFNKEYGNFNDAIIHESLIIDGERGTIEEPLNHYSFPTIGTHLQKMKLYAELSAKKNYKEGKTVSILAAITKAKLKFIKMYFVQFGFLDGWHGLVLCLNSAYGAFLKYIMLWELSNKKSVD